MTSDDTYVLDDAKRRVYDRADTHGEPEDSFAQIARQWTTWMDDDVTAFDVCVMMTQFKLARVKEGESTYESLLDAAGYIECAARLHVENGTVSDDLVADADELAVAMADDDVTDDVDDTDEDDAVEPLLTDDDDDTYDSGLAVLRDRPNEWVSADMIEQLVDADQTHNARAAVADAAVNMDCVQLRANDGDVQYRYLPERDPPVDTATTPNEYGAACRDASSDDDEPFGVTD